jgi:GNAT superfamily N-acetyltransferase
MTAIVQDVSPAAMVDAIEANLYAFFATYRNLAGWRFHDDSDRIWFTTGVPVSLFNAVLQARFDPTDIPAQIAATLAPYQERGLPVLWWVGPASQPATLGSYLEAYGLRHGGDLTGMALDLQAWAGAVPLPPGVHITQVYDKDDLVRWFQPVVVSFQLPMLADAALFDYSVQLGFAPAVPLRHYIGWQDAEPVAAASLCLGAGVAGIYNVATRPEARGQGIGTALTAAALADAREAGYRVAILHATRMGRNVYRRLGFAEYCTVHQYLWGAEEE